MVDQYYLSFLYAVFEYNALLHDVNQVTYEDFQSCNATSPVVKYASGRDSFRLKRKGHYYFLCSFPNHCKVGQKVDIMVAPPSRPYDAASQNQAPDNRTIPGLTSVTALDAFNNDAPSFYPLKPFWALISLPISVWIFLY